MSEELDLLPIKERLEKVTEGEWNVVERQVSTEFGEYTAYGIEHVADVVEYYDSDPAHTALDPLDAEDAEFIAHAKTDIPALIAEVERLRTENEKLSQPFDSEKVEIINGWLVERGAHLGEHIPGYGTLPYSDAEPILNLSEIPGYPDEERCEKAFKQIRRVREIAENSVGGFIAERVLEALQGDGDSK